MTIRLFPPLAVLAMTMLAIPPGLGAEPEWRHATALVGEPKYAEGFERLDYVNPNAPKGGTLNLSASDSFDTLNPIPAKGDLAVGLELVFETLMTSSEDEIAANYGLLAEAVRFPEDYSWVSYRLRENARWHDGEAVTAEDVVWSFEQTVAHNPQREFYYRHVVKAEKTGPREITFTFDEKNNKELPKIVGELLILPKHWWEDAEGEPRAIDETTLLPVMGSGPYRIANIRPGESMTYEKADDYWGKDLNVNVGRHNFDRVTYTYFGDRNVEFEAFKAGDVDFWRENEAKRWANSYDFPAATEGRIIREEPENLYRSSGVLVGFIPNLRREKFSDPRVRRALNYAYNFEEQNKNLFFGAYQRIDSFFYGTEFASSGLPEGKELEILESLRGQIPESVFTTPYENPVGGNERDVQANMRANLREAISLFREAGYELRDGRMVNAKTGEPFTFEILLNGAIIEKVALPYAENLKRIGVDVSVRVLSDSSQYQNRLRSRDFDMIYFGWSQSMSPGNEQAEYWGSGAADREGSANYGGIADPAIDQLVKQVAFAEDREMLIATVRALDRVLLAHHFVVPTYTLRNSRLAYWDHITHPEELPYYGLGFPDVWWFKGNE
ncbi:MAG: extracellular solute-binding protein [Hoeflea sp.]|uniref:extracellular solute-binding protein n=1 Tax=Hoeflea sp. TaxID=1940281 RepID=UPI0032EC3B44